MPQVQLTIAIFNESKEWSLPQHYVDQIAHAAGEGVAVHSVHTRAELLEALPQTTYLIGLPPADEHSLLSAPNLKWIQLTGPLGDLESAIFPALRSGIRVCTATSIRAAQIAEHALALTLALVRRLDLACSFKSDQRWAPHKIASRLGTLRGASLGIIARGPVGPEISARAKAFGMHVLAARERSHDSVAPADEAILESQLGELLARSDVVIVAAPRTPSTADLLGKTQLGQMKPTAVLVDVSSAGVVHQPSLLDALRRRRISGAGLDVFDTEPLAPNSPFWTLPNVIITPHVAAASPNYWADATELIRKNLRRFRNNEPLIDEVNQEWYTPVAI